MVAHHFPLRPSASLKWLRRKVIFFIFAYYFLFVVSNHACQSAHLVHSRSKQQMESRRSHSTSADTEQELNRSNVQEHWSRANRVSRAPIVLSHLRLKLWWLLECWRGSLEVGGSSDSINPVCHNVLFPFHSRAC